MDMFLCYWKFKRQDSLFSLRQAVQEMDADYTTQRAVLCRLVEMAALFVVGVRSRVPSSQ